MRYRGESRARRFAVGIDCQPRYHRFRIDCRAAGRCVPSSSLLKVSHMMKMMILAPRRPSMTHAEFRDYVTKVHGPLVLSVPEVAAGIRRYHYNFPIAGERDVVFGHPLASHLDIVTQGWFDSRDAQLLNMEEPRYMQIIRPDEGKFANEAGAVMHYTHEALIKDGPETQTKIFYFRRRHPSLSRDQFKAAWAERFAAAVASHPRFSAVVSRYVQNQTYAEADHPQGDSEKFFDVMDEFHVTKLPALGELAGDAGYLVRVRDVERELTAASRTLAYIGETIYNKR